MKYLLALTLVLTTQFSFAQTMREKKIREEMLNRVDLIALKVDETRELLKKEDVVNACVKIQDLYEIYPDHVKDVGTHLDMFQSKVIDIRNEALSQLIFIHRQSLICKQGKDSEYLDMGLVDKSFKVIRKSLEKQKKVINKSDTNFDNTFTYEYEF